MGDLAAAIRVSGQLRTERFRFDEEAIKDVLTIQLQLEAARGDDRGLTAAQVEAYREANGG